MPKTVTLRKIVSAFNTDLFLNATDTSGPMFAISALLSFVYKYKT